MSKNKIANIIAAILIPAANAANVLPTPGSSAGYLYFPAASSGASGTGGSGGATVTGCYVGMTIPADVSTTPMPCVPGDPVYASGTDNTVIGKYAGLSPNTMKHLIAATADSAQNVWCSKTVNTVTNFLDGASNTTNMVNDCPGSAARSCRALGLDWFLPAYYDLQHLYANRTVIGGFSNLEYWSSSASDTYGAWRLLFSNGVWVTMGMTKLSSNYVRCARYF